MASCGPQLSREYIRPGDRVCAAVSGGADSVAMLLLLHEANALPRNGLGVGLSAVHVHHGLRGEEADGDLEFVQELCARLGVPLHVARASVSERMVRVRAAGKAETVEEAARNLRYEVFRRVIYDGSADCVLTAHTLDDQAETVLMKLLRGAWTEGLSAIHPVVEIGGPTDWKQRAGNLEQCDGRTGKIVRPLLRVRRAELEEYLRGRRQPWRTDSSNADEAFSRNRVRHHLLPILRQYNPKVEESLANVAVLAREDEARWQAEMTRVLPQVLLPGRPVRGGGRAVSTAAGESAAVALEIERMRGFDPALRRRVVRAAARSLGVRLGFDDTARLLTLAGFGEDAIAAARPGGRLQLAGGLSAERSARELRLSRTESAAEGAQSTHTQEVKQPTEIVD